MQRERFPIETAAVLGLALLACVPPQSRFRHSGVVPETRALGWDGQTVKAGSLRVEGELHQTDIGYNSAPVYHDTALHEATTSLDGVATLALVDHLELGGRVSYAAYAWTDPTANGTMPVPGNPSLWGYGPEVRWAIPLDSGQRVHLGLAGNALSYSLPVARWTLDSTCAPPQTCFDGYKLDSTTNETMWVYNLALYPSVRFGPDGAYGHLFGGLSGHDSFKNDGFTDQVGSDQGKPQKDAFVLFGGAGYGIDFHGVRTSAMLYVPLNGDQAIRQGPGFFVTLGGAVSLWHTGSGVHMR